MAAGAGWLWWQASNHDRALLNYRAAAAEMENIGRAAANWRAEASRVWADALADVGVLDSFAAEVDQHRQDLARSVLGLPRLSARLANDLSAYSNAIDAHAKRAERFQSNLEALRVAETQSPEHRATNGAPTVELLVAATATDLGPFATALETTLKSAAAATAQVLVRDQSTAVALAGGMSLPWIAFAVVRGKGSVASFTRQRPRSLPRTPRTFVRRRTASNGSAETSRRETARDLPVADDLPPTGDVRATYALLRARALAEFLTEELNDVANGMDDDAPARTRLAGLAHGLAATRMDSNTHYEVLDVNECVNAAVAAGTRCGLVTVTKRLGVVSPVFASGAETVVLLANVVENAARAARSRHGDGGEIKVATAEKRGKATITIADNGAGLPTEAEQLFKPFHALRNGHFGIGLAMARRLAVRNGGTIALASAAGEKGGAGGSATGTVARVTLPLA